MRCTVTQFGSESVGLCPFRGSYLREFELSLSNLGHKELLDFVPFRIRT